MIGRLRAAYERYLVRRQRRRLIYAYAKLGRVRHNLGPGFSPLLFAYGRLENEGLATIERTGDDSAQLVWHWPEDAPDVKQGGDDPT